MRRLLISAAAAAVAAAVVLIFVSPGGSPQRPSRKPTPLPPGTQAITVGAPLAVQPIRPGFLGLSFEYSAIESYAGTNPGAIDPVFEQLIRNLVPGQAPVIRIGGDTTDHTWWPVAGLQPPGGIKYTLDDRWLEVTRALARALGAKLILGINLEADSPVLAAAETRALLDGIGRGSIEALEPGNEPELYGIFTWYRTPSGLDVKGRPHDYDLAQFTRDFSTLTHALPAIPIAGPTIGAPKWFHNLGAVLAADPRIQLVTLHRYPTQYCFARPGRANYPTIGHLLSSFASTGMAGTVAKDVALAHAHGLPLRIDEMNTISCGWDPAVGYTFASALWSIDALFAMAEVGVDGVNIHSFPTSTCSLFAFANTNGRWRAFVEPEYYGLMMFAQAAPPGSTLLHITGAAPGGLRAWATRAPDGRIRVVLLNESPTRALTIAVKSPGSAEGPATLERLQAPSLSADRGVTLGGQSFGSATLTGVLQGPRQVEPIPDRQGRFLVPLPSGSAALLTFA